jgi:hypothetical protein
MGVESIAIVAIVLMIMALGLVVLGYRRTNQDVVIEERLNQYGQQRVLSLEEYELEQPFQDRIVLPLLRKLARFGARLTPGRAMESLRQDLLEAGSPSGIGPTEYLGIRVFTSMALSGMTLLMFLLAGADLLLGLSDGLTGLLVLQLSLTLSGAPGSGSLLLGTTRCTLVYVTSTSQLCPWCLPLLTTPGEAVVGLARSASAAL